MCSFKQQAILLEAFFAGVTKTISRVSRLPNPNGADGPQPIPGQRTFDHHSSEAFGTFFSVSSLDQFKYRAQSVIRLQLLEDNYTKAFNAPDPVNMPDSRTFNISAHPCFHKAMEAFKSACALSVASGRSQDAEKAAVLTDEQQQLVLDQPAMQPDHPQGLAYLVQWGCMFWHLIRGSSQIYDVRRGELTIVHDPATGTRGVRYKEALQKKTRTATDILKRCGSSSAAHHVEPVVWNSAWADILQLYYAVLPPAGDCVISKCVPPEVFVTLKDDQSKQCYAPVFMKPRTKTRKAPDGFWFFENQRLGENQMRNLVRQVCEPLGFKGLLTNTSGRATLACNMVRAGIPDSLGMRFTGHHSLNSYRAYNNRHGVGEVQASSAAVPALKQPDMSLVPVGSVNLGRSPSSSRTDVYLPPPRPEPQPPAGLPAQQSHPQSAKRSMADIDLEPEVDVPSASIPVPSLPNNELARKSPPRREKDMLAAIPPNSAGKRPRPSPSSDFKAFLSAMSTSDRRGIFLFADFR